MSDKPSKEQVRTWTQDRWGKKHKPLPDQKEIKRQLGRDLIDIARKEKRKK